MSEAVIDIQGLTKISSSASPPRPRGLRCWCAPPTQLTSLPMDVGTVQRRRGASLEETYLKHVGKA